MDIDGHTFHFGARTVEDNYSFGNVLQAFITCLAISAVKAVI
jgi:hypothetical protein